MNKEKLNYNINMYFALKHNLEVLKEEMEALKVEIKIEMGDEEVYYDEDGNRIRFKEQIRNGWDSKMLAEKVKSLGEDMEQYKKVSKLRPLFVESKSAIEEKKNFRK